MEVRRRVTGFFDVDARRVADGFGVEARPRVTGLFDVEARPRIADDFGKDRDVGEKVLPLLIDERLFLLGCFDVTRLAGLRLLLRAWDLERVFFLLNMMISSVLEVE